MVAATNGRRIKDEDSVREYETSSLNYFECFTYRPATW